MQEVKGKRRSDHAALWRVEAQARPLFSRQHTLVRPLANAVRRRGTPIILICIKRRVGCPSLGSFLFVGQLADYATSHLLT